jgi:hypothetical protein
MTAGSSAGSPAGAMMRAANVGASTRDAKCDARLARSLRLGGNAGSAMDRHAALVGDELPVSLRGEEPLVSRMINPSLGVSDVGVAWSASPRRPLGRSHVELAAWLGMGAIYGTVKILVDASSPSDFSGLRGQTPGIRPEAARQFRWFSEATPAHARGTPRENTGLARGMSVSRRSRGCFTRRRRGRRGRRGRRA